LCIVGILSTLVFFVVWVFVVGREFFERICFGLGVLVHCSLTHHCAFDLLGFVFWEDWGTD